MEDESTCITKYGKYKIVPDLNIGGWLRLIQSHLLLGHGLSLGRIHGRRGGGRYNLPYFKKIRFILNPNPNQYKIISTLYICASPSVFAYLRIICEWKYVRIE
jgi:hypothetical protein